MELELLRDSTCMPRANCKTNSANAPPFCDTVCLPRCAQVTGMVAAVMEEDAETDDRVLDHDCIPVAPK
eukprot:scaffold146267_cov18-Tisochrysis_lutea.AAC.1